MKLKNWILFFLVFHLSLCTHHSFAQFFDALKWRMIGPHRGGRTVGAVGVPQQPNVFYIGVNNGGVWKTTDYGRTWKPIFDDQPTGSIGDVVVAPSNPNVIYVGAGEGLQRPDLSVGDGMYKSTDAGKTWTHLGLANVQQIGGLAIDPTNENRVFVAALGHPYGPNTERGVYRTTDGGKTWELVLYKDQNTGAIQVTLDPTNPNIVYADLWAARQGPWENGAWQGTESGLYKSTDGGNTWKKLTNGLPTVEQGLGRIGFGIAPSNSNRLYATVDAPEVGGIFRSDDGGENWTRTTQDGRIWGRGSDFAEIKVHPTNADIVFSADVDTWKSEDGGKTWNAFRGAPGGDDYHRLWINPTNPDIILLAGDQGAIITVNGGQTFGSWYNQPTAQFYHVSTDNAFPYNVYGGQQESGSVGISSRGNDGQIGIREWHPVGVEEYGYVAADPLDPNVIYGGKITRFDKRTGQVQNIAPEAVRSGKYRFVRTAPVLFSPIDPKTLYFAGNVLFKTRDGGSSWQEISPDLTRESHEDIPESVGIYKTEAMKKMPRRGVIYTIAPSPRDINTIWAGTDDGLIQVTKNGGKTWSKSSDMGAWSKVSMLEASHFDANVAYAAINRIRCSDMKPHIVRTRDGGKTWQEIVKGLPNDPINTVREDPIRKELLFAGSERAVYVSFDDGENWQSLRLNMPATSIRDLVIKDDDVVVGTHGRSFWILDNISSFRQQPMTQISGLTTILFKPQTALRVRWNNYTDTPTPQEEPAGQNPPDGAMIDYHLPKNTTGEVTLEIFDLANKSIRKFSSNDKRYDIPDLNIPLYWIRPQQILSNKAGNQRFVWDLHYKPLDVPPTFPISATYQNTAPDATSPWVRTGSYTVKLTANGQTYSQPLAVTIDPRVKTPTDKLKQIHDLSLQCYEGRQQARKLLTESEELRKVSRYTEEGMKKVMDREAALKKTDAAFATLLNILESTDMPPTTQTVTAVKAAIIEFERLKK
jgi:photosystem II stability/assembly factor-like uncharacterized protein